MLRLLASHEGFVDNDLSLCLFTDHQIFERFHKYNLRTQSARAGKMALTMKELQEMEPGDFVVHVDYGIGKFAGLVRVPVGDSFKEVIRIVYQGNDKVDVSIHSLYKISKYKRSDTGEAPRLSTLGTGAWDRLKEKAKKRIKDIARDLIKLYAKRRHEIGFAFSQDSYLQHELEGSFLYEDTPDQMKATAEVKADMESKRPMDRLVCGDVGFGKTEVAVRAAFKAACDSKQVAVLVPTTVLAFQHYHRARSAKHTKQILADLADGKIDILVGTHKLLGKAVKWHDIGLLIIDEEQKFGVSTKEKLRQLKTNIDTLTMSATPIPRTLQFSLMGARDMSIMRTPPPNRYPIQTEVTTFSVETIIDAINFEMSRNGQVYFVNDRISNLEELGRIIEKHIPDCRVAIGHGRMTPESLEKIVMGFMNHDYDVLLSTSYQQQSWRTVLTCLMPILSSSMMRIALASLTFTRCVAVWAEATERRSAISWHRLFRIFQQSLAEDLRLLRHSPTLVLASTSPCRISTFVVLVIFSVQSSRDSWRILAMKPIKRFSLKPLAS